MSYTPISDLIPLVEKFTASYPKSISMFWIIKMMYPLDVRPVLGTNYYTDTVKQIGTILRSHCPDMRIGMKKIILTKENLKTLKRTNLINNNVLVTNV